MCLMVLSVLARLGTRHNFEKDNITILVSGVSPFSIHSDLLCIFSDAMSRSYWLLKAYASISLSGMGSEDTLTSSVTMTLTRTAR